MKYSSRFERDYEWYLKVGDFFNFDGSQHYHNKKGKPLVVHDQEGSSAKECFFMYDSTGKISPTKEPKLLKYLYKTKGSVNLHIKMYAEDRASGVLPKVEFDKICEQYNVPEWFVKAVETQKTKYY